MNSDTDSTQRFSTRVGFYVRSRPRYPSNLIPFLKSALGVLPAHVIADIGSGTGFLCEPFLSNGNPVFGVEPNAPMREAAESLLAKFQISTEGVGYGGLAWAPNGHDLFFMAPDHQLMATAYAVKRQRVHSGQAAGLVEHCDRGGQRFSLPVQCIAGRQTLRRFCGARGARHRDCAYHVRPAFRGRAAAPRKMIPLSARLRIN
jgi:hypothetical protein